MSCIRYYACFSVDIGSLGIIALTGENCCRFMYQGEVHIGQEQLKEFLRAAQLLQVRGLTDVPAPAPLATLDQKPSPVSYTLSALLQLLWLIGQLLYQYV